MYGGSMTQPTSSQWSFYRNQQSNIDAKVTIKTLQYKLNPISISFHCSRSVSCIDKNICNVFQNAIDGNAHVDMIQNPFCSHEQVIGGCGNKRGYLSECRCEILNRVDKPEVRKNYENKVINTILQKFSDSMNSFHLKLAIFCSGELLGEQILLFRLLHKLKQKKAAGTIELFLIDRCYKQAIRNSCHDRNFEDSVGKEKYIEQFLREICQCLPQNITLKGNFFYSAKMYIKIAKINNAFKHHLLIGADIENTNVIMGNIGREAGLGIDQPPIVLIKKSDPWVCQLDPSGNLENCYIPGGKGTAHFNRIKDNQQRRSTNRSNDNLTLAIGGGVTVGFSLLALVTFLGISLKDTR